MKKSYIIIIAIAAFVGLGMIAVGLMPTGYSVSRQIEVNASPERVYGLVANVKEWSSWYPMYRTEPLGEYLYAGKVQEAGSSIRFKGLDIGQGEVLITQVNPPLSVSARKEIKTPETLLVSYEWSVAEMEAGKVLLTWTEHGSARFPWQRSRAISRAAPYLEQGLSQLKEVSELRPLQPPSVPLDPFPDAPNDL